MVCKVNGQIVECPEFLQNLGSYFGAFHFIIFAIVVFVIAGYWKIFKKAGKPGWAAIVPIYNIIVMLEIAKKPTWWILLMLIPFVNIIILIIMMIALAKSFGKGSGFGVGLALLSAIFVPILGFGKAQYIGTPNIENVTGTTNNTPVSPVQ